MKPKKLLAGTMKYLLIAVVAAFTGLLSYSFWQWTFPPEQWYYALLGFGLTGGAAIVYLVMLLWDSGNSDLQDTIALVMMVVSMIGEVITAGYGIQLETSTRAGFVPTQEDFKFMTMVVQILILAHFISIVAYFAGDKIAEMFEERTGKDLNRDGVIGKKKKNNRLEHTPSQQSGTSYSLSDLSTAGGKTPAQMLAEYPDYDAFAEWAAGQFDTISGGNMKRIWYGEINPTQPVANKNGRR